jgi:hypothetical protein
MTHSVHSGNIDESLKRAQYKRGTIEDLGASEWFDTATGLLDNDG